MAGESSVVGDWLDVLFEVLFWVLLALAGCTAVWQLFAECSLGEPKREEPEEWEKLPEEDKAELRRWTRN